MAPHPPHPSSRPQRAWTQAEVEKLAREYNARLPGTCPVCAREVSFISEARQGTRVLVIRCRVCRNLATIQV